MRRHLLPLLPVVVLTSAMSVASGADEPGAARRERAQQFHLRAQQPTGLLVPMYVYPANIHTNPQYNRLIELKRRFATVPMWVILNPASGPGEQIDANYTKAIDRLHGAGCVVLGYVTTSYGSRAADEVHKDIDRWLAMYPSVQGIFFDEMGYEDTETKAEYQVELNRYAHAAGCWPTVANPGAETPGRYFAADAADVIVVHEGDAAPSENRLKGDYFGGYADYPPFTRGVLLHSQPQLDDAALRMICKHARWVYVTEALYRPGDPTAANPWDRLSHHMEEMCKQLSLR